MTLCLRKSEEGQRGVAGCSIDRTVEHATLG